MAKQVLILSAFLGFLAVALGAFGAHALKTHLDDASLKIFHTGIQYQFFHTIALALVGILGITQKSFPVRVPATAFSLGIVLFSGSLYLLAVTQQKFWGMITPLGGVCFLVGWAALALSLRGTK